MTVYVLKQNDMVLGVFDNADTPRRRAYKEIARSWPDSFARTNKDESRIWIDGPVSLVVFQIDEFEVES